MQLALSAIGWLSGLIRPTIHGAWQALPHLMRLMVFVLNELLGGLAVWIGNIPETCRETADQWKNNAIQSNMSSSISQIVYGVMYLVTLVEIVAVSIILAHIVVFAIFAAILFL